MSLFFGNRLNRICMAPDPAPPGGGGNPPAPTPPAPPADPKDKMISDLTARLEALEAKNKPPGEPPKPDDDLARKAQLAREEKEKASKNSKRLESALKFTMGVKEWAKTNVNLLPKTIDGILAQAEKEVYGDAVEKDNAIKVGIVSEYFSIQSNLELLTESQKTALVDFKKLTENDKQERVQQVFENIFEPTFEMIKRIKKAEQLRGGQAAASDAESAYREKLSKGSRKHYLGEKENA